MKYQNRNGFAGALCPMCRKIIPTHMVAQMYAAVSRKRSVERTEHKRLHGIKKKQYDYLIDMRSSVLEHYVLNQCYHEWFRKMKGLGKI